MFAKSPLRGDLEGPILKKLRGVETPRFKPKLSASRPGRGLREKIRQLLLQAYNVLPLKASHCLQLLFLNQQLLQIARIIYQYHSL